MNGYFTFITFQVRTTINFSTREENNIYVRHQQNIYNLITAIFMHKDLFFWFFLENQAQKWYQLPKKRTLLDYGD